MDSPPPAPLVPAKRPYEDDVEEVRFPNGHSRTKRPSSSLSPNTESDETLLYDSKGRLIGELIPNCPWPLPKINTISVDIPETTLIFPESLYNGFEPPAPVTTEGLAIDLLQRKTLELVTTAPSPPEQEDEEFQEFTLEDFSIYVDSAITGLEMKPLQYLNARVSGHTQYYFDGVLRVSNEKYFLEKVPFKELSVGNYGSKNDSVNGQIWIRSSRNEVLGQELYYKLGQPSKCYSRYFDKFVWISNLAKYFVDYLEECLEQDKSVCIHDFREAFLETTAARHQESPAFNRWFNAYGKRDFRVPISSNAEFLYKEACGVLSPGVVQLHRIFREILSFDEYEPVLPGKCDTEVPPTIVTPYVARCFDHLPCGSVIQPLELNPKVETLRERVADPVSLELTRRATRGFAPKAAAPSTVGASLVRDAAMLQSIKPGDTISIQRDPESLSKWVCETPHGLAQGSDNWYGLVQAVDILDGRRTYKVIWYYHPVDTICGVMKYPIPNELFLSDHCTCIDNIRIDQDEVLGVHPVAFWPALPEGSDLVCRQTYHEAEQRFTTYREADRVCICNRKFEGKLPVDEFSSKYRLGDAVLVKSSRNGQLEPFELVDIDTLSRKATLRYLRRRHTLEKKNFRPNEVVYTDELVERALSAVKRKCSVHVQMDGGKIPAPYDRDGVGNLFFMTHFWDGQKCIPLEKQPTLNRPPSGEKLLGLDLFCGVGNFGRGIEEGGAVDMQWANDNSDKAIHAYMANATDRVAPFLGSIDVLQERAIQGRFGTGVPEVGLVGFISGGSPCPGFSALTHDKTTPNQRKNQSLVAAFASMVDLYRPRHGILENVLGIVQNQASKREDVFCQLICALVGMGYQVQMLFLDAWSYGSCQSRSRVFLVFAAPGETLP
ncbi:DNA cytosine methyltransferase, partial [Candidatus Bathyarchaeota archaeon]|nr:DNA cytosine methyltransferase [Candidatus Bathyarchaeota archaeon]